jgi:hypothetical protein
MKENHDLLCCCAVEKVTVADPQRKSKAFDHGAHSKKDTDQLRASQKAKSYRTSLQRSLISKPQKKKEKEKENRKLLLRSTETATGSTWAPQSDRAEAEHGTTL